MLIKLKPNLKRELRPAKNPYHQEDDARYGLLHQIILDYNPKLTPTRLLKFLIEDYAHFLRGYSNPSLAVTFAKKHKGNHLSFDIHDMGEDGANAIRKLSELYERIRKGEDVLSFRFGENWQLRHVDTLLYISKSYSKEYNPDSSSTISITDKTKNSQLDPFIDGRVEEIEKELFLVVYHNMRKVVEQKIYNEKR